MKRLLTLTFLAITTAIPAAFAEEGTIAWTT